MNKAVNILLFLVVAPIGFVVSVLNYSKFYTCCFSMAVCIDKSGNVIMATVFNLILIKSSGHKFGCVDETISSVLGKNQVCNTLKPLGWFLVKVLDKIQKNHCEISIETEINIPE